MRVRTSMGSLFLVALLAVVGTLGLLGQPAVAAPVSDQGGSIGVGAGAAPFGTVPGAGAKAEPRAGARGVGRAAAQYRKYTAWYGPVTIKADSWHEAWVFCPDGMLATGGGEYNSSAGGVTLHHSYALDGGRGWRVQVSNGGTADATFRVYAVCFSGLSGYQHVYAKSLVQARSFGDAWAGCPHGVALVGGGGTAETYWSTVDSHPDRGMRAWRFAMENKDGAARTVQSQAICANGIQGQVLAESPYIVAGPTEYYQAVAVSCPGDSWVVSGGGFAPRITDSHPEGEGWRLYYHNPVGARTSAQAMAICGR